VSRGSRVKKCDPLSSLVPPRVAVLVSCPGLVSTRLGTRLGAALVLVSRKGLRYITHWFSMLDRPRKSVAQWYPLVHEQAYGRFVNRGCLGQYGP